MFGRDNSGHHEYPCLAPPPSLACQAMDATDRPAFVQRFARERPPLRFGRRVRWLSHVRGSFEGRVGPAIRGQLRRADRERRAESVR
jgi:hypothetical protein